MRIKLDFVAFLDVKGVKPGEEVELEEGSTIAGLLDCVGIASHHQQHVRTLVDGEPQRLDYVLHDGEAVALLGRAGGG